MVHQIVAIDTYGSQRVTDPRTRQVVSAYKLGYSSAVTAILLALYEVRAREVSPKGASYRYLQLDGEVSVRHGYLLLMVTPDELAKAECAARDYPRAGAYLWRDGRWWELPNSRTAAYAEPIGSAGPRFDPTGFRPVSPSSGERESGADGITAERSRRSPGETPWWWLKGDTYPHRELLRQQGARFSGKRRQWYWVGWELPSTILALIDDAKPQPVPDSDVPPQAVAPEMSPALAAMVEQALAEDDVQEQSGLPPEPAPNLEPEAPAIRISRPTPFPTEGEPLDAIQTAIREAKAISITPPTRPAAPIRPTGRAVPIAQAYCGELTGSITGQVYCYGWAIHDGVCVYVNMGGPRSGVEAIRAKLSKGEIVTIVPEEAPAVELTAGEGNTGMYHASLQTIPEARFTSLILLHDWAVHPNYGGAATTFILRTSEEQAQAKLRHHVAQLVNLPVFDAWTSFLWQAGHAAMLVRPTRSAGGMDLLTVALDATAWTRLITGGLEQGAIALPRVG
ncbi:MAG: hypothetical protein HUU31_18735 [Anaerolineae bacterium]|nr:hypothetical protein [Anaerolineae bacterium]